jgi:DNA-binding NarL/FixJ family response regulator
MNHIASNAGVQAQAAVESSHVRGYVLIVEEDPAVRGRLAQMVNGEADLRVCAGVRTCQEAASLVRELKPDLILVDASGSAKNSLQSLNTLRVRSRDTKLLVLSMKHAAAYADQVLKAGADGYLTTEDMDQVADAIRDVLAGSLFVSEQAAGCPSSAGGSRLTKRAASRSESMGSTRARRSGAMAAA